MAYTASPHLSFLERASKLLLKKKVAVKNCTPGSVANIFYEASKNYLFWPQQRTAFICTLSHEDSQYGPQTIISFSVFFEFVDINNARTAVSNFSIALRTPLLLDIHPKSVTIKSGQYKNLKSWFQAVATNTLVLQVSRKKVTWTRYMTNSFLKIG